MKNNYLEFSKRLQKNGVKFSLACSNNRYELHHWPLIILDQEDLAYFKSKYLPKIEDQYQQELRILREKYNKS